MTLMDGYKRANEALHPTEQAVEGALSGGAPRKRRRPLRAAVPAAVVRAVAASAGADDAPLRYILITQFMGKEVCFL